MVFPRPVRELNEVNHHIDGDDQVGDDRVISGFNGITDRNHGMPLIASGMVLFLKTIKLAGGYDALAYRPPVERVIVAQFHAD